MNNSSTYTSFEEVEAAAYRMQAFYATGKTRSLEYRRQALIRLQKYLKANEMRIFEALYDDLGKAPFEAYATELGLVLEEIRMCLKNLNKWAKPKRVPTSIAHFPSSSKVYASPQGVVLVMSPWNYPLQLALVPLVDAITAGNCVALKPSRTSKATNILLSEMISEVFPPEYVCTLPGSSAMNDWLLDIRWDHLFFTGSTAVGKTIMTAAAKNLTPVTLELGGKSPCIIDKSAHIKRAAQRIAWGKSINSGQTCVAPDYFLVHDSIADEFVSQLEYYFNQYYGDDIIANPEWPRMISERHFNRVLGLINNHSAQTNIAFGGRSNAEILKIEPTCLRGVSLDDPVMKEEIFGPAMPVLTYQTIDEAFSLVNTFEKPLAAYVFAEDKTLQQRVIQELAFGGATINDVVIHLSNHHMGFGGVGASGMGSYHGKTGFDCFTHYKATLTKGTWLELPIRVPPFKDKLKILKLFLR